VTNLLLSPGAFNDPFWGTSNLTLEELDGTTSPTGVRWRLASKNTAHAVDPAKYLIQSLVDGHAPLSRLTLSALIGNEDNWNGTVTLWLRVGEVSSMYGTFNVTTGALEAVVRTAQSDTTVGLMTEISGGTINETGGFKRLWISGVLPAQSVPVGVILWNNQVQEVGNSFLCGGLELVSGALGVGYTATVFAAPQAFITWDWPFHSFETRYQANSTVVQMGRGYSFASRPTSPPQRIFSLKMEGLRYFLDNEGLPNPTRLPQHNAYRLDLFYQQVQLYTSFIYPHPVYGNMVVRFNKPLVLPEVRPGGAGVLGPVSVELIEIP
jgi:hypothetical protein